MGHFKKFRGLNVNVGLWLRFGCLPRWPCDVSCGVEILQLVRHVHERWGDPVWRSANPRPGVPLRESSASWHRWAISCRLSCVYRLLC